MENTRRSTPAPRGKRLFAALLAAMMTFGLFPLSALADANTPVGVNNYVATLVADPLTSTPPTGVTPGDFGTPAADGRVWTDKSVNVNGNNFEVTLSALAQEYRRTKTTTTTTQVAADVALVIDMSLSMSSNNAKRVEPMIDSVNKAIDTIMKANPENRVGVYYFGLQSQVGTVLELASYRAYNSTASDAVEITGTGDTKDRYITFLNDTTIDAGPKNATTAPIKKTTLTASGPVSSWLAQADASGNITTSSGTATQRGLYLGINALINDTIIKNKNTTVGKERYPYVLLFTDGGANYATETWYGDVMTISGQTGTTTGDAIRSALTILTAAKLKQELKDAYAAYNSKSKDPIWFNIGFFIDANTYASALLEPVSVKTGSSGEVLAVYNQIGTELAKLSGENTQYNKYGPAGDPGHVFAKYVYYARSAGELDTAFQQLSRLIKEATQEKVLPVDIVTTSGQAATGVVFTDKLGEHMVLAGAPKLAGVSGTGTTAGTKTTYTFANFESTAVYDSDDNTLTWNIAANELPLYKIDEPTNENSTYTAANPIRLIYNVRMAEGYDGGYALYSNAFDETVTALTAAVFTPTVDNPYYYNVVTYTHDEADAEHDEGDYKSSTPKAVSDSIAKTPENATGTAAYSHAFAFADGQFTTTLGNNGKLTPILNITKTSDRDSVFVGDEGVVITYTVVVHNFTSDEVSNVEVGDTLPAGLELVANSLTVNSAPAVFDLSDPSSFTYTIESILAGGTVTLTYKATLSTELAKTYTNKATINYVQLGPNGQPQPVTPKAETEISVVVGDPLPAKVVVTLDASAYGGRTVTLHRKGSSLKYTLSEGTSGTYDGAEVLEGDYDIYVDDVPTGITLKVTSGENEAQVDFYTVTFYDGGTKYDDPAQQIVLSGGKAGKPSNPTKAGYIFVKWVDKDGNEFDFTNTAITAPTDIYALWTQAASNVDIPEITVTFDSQGGTPVSPITTAPHTRINPPVPPTRPGYLFTGWYKDSACTIPWDFTQRVNYNMTLYAGWIASTAVVVPKTGGSDAWLGFAMATSALLLAGAVQLGKRKKEQ